MNEKTKLVIGISLPLIIILIVVALSVVPKFFFNPKYDFVYTVGSSCGEYYYYCNNYGAPWSSYKIVDGKITKETELPKFPDGPKENKPTLVYPTIYYFDVTKGTFKEISFEEARKLNLINGTAPDGTIVTSGYDNNNGGVFGMMFGGGGYSTRNGLYLRNGRASEKIVVQNGTQNDYYYNSNFHLVGWVN